MQVKGDSECRNGLSRVIGAPDELCDFEKLRKPQEDAEDCEDAYGSGGMLLSGCLSRWSYVRYALVQGLQEEEKLGVNSFKYGIVAATDNHTGAGGAVAEDKFLGSTGVDRQAQVRLKPPVEIPFLAKAQLARFNPGGIAGLWAQQNSRESLFAAMKRRETFGTSGPRIIPRFFGGWHYKPGLCNSQDMVEQAYAGGVSMGGDLPTTSQKDAKPSFIVSALRDSSPGATPLQKIQIIKGWMDGEGNMHQQVIDVAGESESEASVNTDTCERSGAGHSSLCAVWRDAAFDPSLSAVYYARVLENPSCRWTSYDCNSLPKGQRPQACADPTLPKTIRERAWTSPIWYAP